MRNQGRRNEGEDVCQKCDCAGTGHERRHHDGDEGSNERDTGYPSERMSPIVVNMLWRCGVSGMATVHVPRPEGMGGIVLQPIKKPPRFLGAFAAHIAPAKCCICIHATLPNVKGSFFEPPWERVRRRLGYKITVCQGHKFWAGLIATEQNSKYCSYFNHLGRRGRETGRPGARLCIIGLAAA
jgi:hypothetical protein